jgi:PD-(D/E)XK endonuclease
VNTKSIGERTEAIVLAEFLKAGFVVLLPFGDNQRYDMVIDLDGTFMRVQCKTARLVREGAALSLPTASSYAHRGGARRNYRDEADLFAAYSPDTGQVYVLRVDDVGETEVYLRLTPALNGQTKNVRNAADHLLSVWQQSPWGCSSVG